MTMRRATMLMTQRRGHFMDVNSFPWIKRVPQNHELVIERFGKYHSTRTAGLTAIVPFVDVVAHGRGLMESSIEIDFQHAITEDNVQVKINGYVYYCITNTYKSCYEIDNPVVSITNLSQSSMRKQVGTMTLDALFHNRVKLNDAITEDLKDLNDEWGIKIMRYEVNDINMYDRTADAMEKQSASERQKRATILDSEAAKIAKVNESEGRKVAIINEAEADARSVILSAQANAEGIRLFADAISAPGGEEAVRAKIAAEYIDKMADILKNSQTTIVPVDPTNITGMMERAMAIKR